MMPTWLTESTASWTETPEIVVLSAIADARNSRISGSCVKSYGSRHVFGRGSCYTNYMQCRTGWLLSAAVSVSISCGDDSGRRNDGGGDSIATLDGTAGETDTVDTHDSHGSHGDASTTSSGPSTQGDPTSDGDSTSNGGDSTSNGGDSTDDGVLPCGDAPQLPFEKLIWIANSGQGTVSKIDTESGAELGRYIVRPDSAGSPSRTSVNRFGDVAVANRLGGVTKIAGASTSCVEKNNMPGIQTSQGGNILPWNEDECVIWHAEIPHGDNRPVAWTNGTYNEETCAWEDVNVWTAWSDVAPGTAVVALLDGTTGARIQEVPIPDLPQPWQGWHGFYGAAVDADNNVWLSQLQGSNPAQAWLVKVDYETFEYTPYPVPGEGGYGMTVTSEGYVWLCGRDTRRFDPQTETWTSVPLHPGGGVHTGGCMGDGQGLLYRGSYSLIHAIDTQTMEVMRTLNVGQPGDDFIWGVAVDFDGYVWGVPRNGTRAYKVDAVNNQIVHTFEGLVSAYTYSDMTGFALINVVPG